MTEKEYLEEQKRVEEYSKLKAEIEKLKTQRARISNGIINIMCAYEKHVMPKNIGGDFGKRLESCICNFIDSEIENCKKKMEKI